MLEGTLTLPVKIDIGVNGIVLTFESMDEELARLMEQAGTYESLPIQYHSLGASTLTIQSKKILGFIDRPAG